MTVTDADRQAAASGYYAWLSGNQTVPNKMLAGKADDHSMVQAFARHREAAEAPLRAEVERLREDRDKALDALFDAIALIGHTMPMHTEALIGGERMIARDVWQKGHDIMFPRKTLEQKP